LNYQQVQIGSYIGKEYLNSHYLFISLYPTENWNNQLFFQYDKAQPNESAKQRLEFISTIHDFQSIDIQVSINYDANFNQLESFGLGFFADNLIIQFMNINQEEPFEKDKTGYNFELFWGDRQEAIIGIGIRKNFSVHYGFFIEDYPISSFFVRARF